MKPIQELSFKEAAGLSYVLTDIDDTLTYKGQLEREAYNALWDLHDQGIGVIPVTGRPAGWCDMIARQWPVIGVVGENGAFSFYLSGEKLQHLYHPSVEREDFRRKFDRIKERVFKEVPGTRIAKDQFARIFDLAIDFREEPPELDLKAAEKIKAICEDVGAQAKISSIHVNTWFGNYNKLEMAKIFMREVVDHDIDRNPGAVLFCGDSPNDEPMFEFFPISAAVANISPFLELMKHHPRYISTKKNGKGFAEITKKILKGG